MSKATIDITPRNDQAEEGIIGRLLIDNGAIDELVPLLTPEDFCSARRAEIYRVMLKLHATGKIADAVSINHELRGDDTDFNDLVHYPARVMGYVSFSGDIEYLARQVIDEKLRRELIYLGCEIRDDAINDTDGQAVLERAESRLLDIGRNRQGGEPQALCDVVQDYREAFTRLEQSHGEMRGLRTGLYGLDKLTRGFRKAKFYVVAGRPATGKTSLLLTMAYNMAFKFSTKVAFFSLEMGKEELTDRLVSMRAQVDGQLLATPWQLAEDQQERVYQAMDDLERGLLYIDDTPALSTATLRSKARRLLAKYGIECVLVDYLQLMQALDSSGRRIKDREQEVAEISMALKALSKELDVPVIALAQLNRGVEARSEKVPMLSDLRSSGQIEQDADMVAFLYNDEQYNPDTKRKGITDLIIAKQRGGPTGEVGLHFEARYTEFRNIVGSEGSK
jgi:replicative DNA helicase